MAEPYNIPPPSNKEVQGIDDDIAGAILEEVKLSHNQYVGCGNGNGNGSNGSNGKGNGKRKQKDKPDEGDKVLPQIPIFKYSTRFRKALHEAILLNDKPV